MKRIIDTAVISVIYIQDNFLRLGKLKTKFNFNLQQYLKTCHNCSFVKSCKLPFWLSFPIFVGLEISQTSALQMFQLLFRGGAILMGEGPNGQKTHGRMTRSKNSRRSIIK